MRSDYDVVVIGAGHNGLTAAATLARRGRRVLVLERRRVVGGIAAREEFHPGYQSAGLLHDSTRVRTDVVEELELNAHGLTLRPKPPRRLALSENGSTLLLGGEATEAARELESVSAVDAARYVEFHQRIERLRAVVRSYLREPPVDFLEVESAGAWDLLRRGLRVRRLGKEDMLELLRLPPMSVADWLDEWFETDTLKAAMALPAVAGGFAGPRSPGTNVNLLFAIADADRGIVGGGPALVSALEAAARAGGVEIRTDAPAERVRPDTGNGHQVVLVGGETISAKVVAAACHPCHLFSRLLAPGSISPGLEHRIRKYRTRGTTAQVLLALEGPARFAARPEASIEFASSGQNLDELEKAFDAIKYRRVSDRPILDIHIPTVADPDLAPSGCSVVSVLVHFVPYELEGGWTDAAREHLGDRVVRQLRAWIPEIAVSTVARAVLTPMDLEALYGLSGGSITHGEHALDQLLVRPVAGCADYRTPIKGLYLCGGGSHPGGGLSCGPGTLAARAILSD